MAKVKISFDKRALQKETTDKINSVINEPQLKTEIGLFATDRIRFQARTGKPLNDDGFFPSLQASTIKRREYLKDFNPTDSTFSPGRSNLTLTGQFLNSLAFKAVRNGIQLLWKGKHKKYRGRRGAIGKVKSNQQIADDLAGLGFFVFTKLGIESNQKFNRQINSIVRRFIRRNLR